MQNESKQSCLRLKVTAFPLITFLICYVHWKTKRPRVEFLGGHILDIVKVMINKGSVPTMLKTPHNVTDDLKYPPYCTELNKIPT